MQTNRHNSNIAREGNITSRYPAYNTWNLIEFMMEIKSLHKKMKKKRRWAEWRRKGQFSQSTTYIYCPCPYILNYGFKINQSNKSLRAVIGQKNVRLQT